MQFLKPKLAWAVTWGAELDNGKVVQQGTQVYIADSPNEAIDLVEGHAKTIAPDVRGCEVVKIERMGVPIMLVDEVGLVKQ